MIKYFLLLRTQMKIYYILIVVDEDILDCCILKVDLNNINLDDTNY